VGTILASTTLAGCFGGNPSSANPAQKVTLTMWGLFDDASVWAPIIKQYEQTNPNVTINYVQKDYASYDEDSFDSLAARTGPDIWLVKGDWMARHYEKLVPAPDTLFATKNTKSLDAYKTMVPDVAYNGTVIAGKIYGAPMSVDSLVLYYNRDIFHNTINRLGQDQKTAITGSDLQQGPSTWKDVIRYDSYLTQKDGNDIKVGGIALGANNVDQSQDVLSALMLQTNTQMITADRKSAGFNLSRTASGGQVTVPGNDALTFFRSFSQPGNANYTWASSMPNSITAFEQGKVAMMVNYGYVQNQLRQESPTLNYSISPLPQIENATTPVDYANYWVETVTKSASNPTVAWDFLKYAMNQDPSYSQASGRPDASRPSDQSAPATVADRIGTGNPLKFEKLSDQDWYKGRRPLEVDGIMRDLIQATVNGDAIQHALDSAAKRVTDMLTGQTPAPTPDATQ